MSSVHTQAVFIPETPYHMVWLATDACTARCLALLFEFRETIA